MTPFFGCPECGFSLVCPEPGETCFHLSKGSGTEVNSERTTLRSYCRHRTHATASRLARLTAPEWAELLFYTSALNLLFNGFPSGVEMPCTAKPRRDGVAE